MSHEVGDIVEFNPQQFFGGSRELPEGISAEKTYKIISIHRCLDGAYGWDDLEFDGLMGIFCEFDFKKVKS